MKGCGRSFEGSGKLGNVVNWEVREAETLDLWRSHSSCLEHSSVQPFLCQHLAGVRPSVPIRCLPQTLVLLHKTLLYSNHTYPFQSSTIEKMLKKNSNIINFINLFLPESS